VSRRRWLAKERAYGSPSPRDRLRPRRRRPLPDFPLGDSLEVFIRREDAERFIEEVRGDDSEVAAKLTVEEWEREAGGRTEALV
jgi:hypothetical protein